MRSENSHDDSIAASIRDFVPPRAYGLPSAADYIIYARTMNGMCATCHTINAHDGSPRCSCSEADRG